MKDSISNNELNKKLIQEDQEQENDFFGQNLLLFHRISSSGSLNYTFTLGVNNSVVTTFDWDCQGLYVIHTIIIKHENNNIIK